MPEKQLERRRGRYPRIPGVLRTYGQHTDRQHGHRPRQGEGCGDYRRPTRVFMDVINKGGPATATLPGVFASPGGVPIMVDGKVTGAVGVSGVTGDQDEQCAKAG